MQLGELEKLLLHYFWDVDRADAKQVHAHFSPRRGGSLNTIQSTLDRLFKKGLLARTKQGHAFHYSAAMARDTFLSKLILDVTRDFVEDRENNLMTAFTSLSSDMDESQLDALEALIASQRKANKEP